VLATFMIPEQIYAEMISGRTFPAGVFRAPPAFESKLRAAILGR
jgi:hypothetical protein